MSAKSQRARTAEIKAAKILGGERIIRHSYSEKIHDVDVPLMPHWKVDSKKYNRFKHHSLLETIRQKYCTCKEEVPILVTQEKSKRLMLITMPIEEMARILEQVRELGTPYITGDVVSLPIKQFKLIIKIIDDLKNQLKKYEKA